MSREDLKKRLLESEAVTSLVSELRVVNYLRELGWSVSQGSFFTDPVTTKMREIDVVARRFWQRGAEPEKLKAWLNLIVEVKTMRGYHLVLAPMLDSAKAKRVIVEREWIGYASERSAHHARLGGTLERLEIEPSGVSTILGQLKKLAYPVELTVTADVIPDPLPAPFLSSAFRETNVGSSKELDASVFWKAAQAVGNYVAYAKADYLSSQYENIELAADYARSQGKNSVDEVLNELSYSVRGLELFHSVIVVDAMLWSVSGEDLKKLPWCRFCQLDRHGSVRRWYDIVQQDCFNQYLAEVTRHYDEYMRKAGGQRLNLYA